MKSTNAVKKLFGAVLVLLVLVMGLHLAAPSRAYSDAAPQILGKTYGEWSALWWQWAVIEPADSNPLIHSDADAATYGPYTNLAALNQKGPAWFLAGEALNLVGTAVVRHVSIPHGKYIFFPITNLVDINGNPALGIDKEPDGRKLVGDAIDRVSQLVCTLDTVDTLNGVIPAPVVFNPNTPIVRTQSPTFNLTFEADNIFQVIGVVAGDWPLSWSDGYWVMLQPLSVGEHTLIFTATASDGNKLQDVTYHLTVK